MSLESSPTFENSGVVESPPAPKKNPLVRVLLGIVGVILVVLLGISITQNGLPSFGSGTVSGSAVDFAGKPISVEVFVFGTDILVQSDANGNFVLEDVPAGEQSLIVSYGEIAAEEKLIVRANAENAIGTVTVPTDLLDLLD